jgi:pimeloyl-ACP methyl ester carboxylesterase
MGEQSRGVSPIWEARHQQLLGWLPNVERFVLPGATHLLHVQDPPSMAFVLMQFFAKHPMSGTH